jgi:hypothetical protein
MKGSVLLPKIAKSQEPRRLRFQIQIVDSVGTGSIVIVDNNRRSIDTTFVATTRPSRTPLCYRWTHKLVLVPGILVKQRCLFMEQGIGWSWTSVIYDYALTGAIPTELGQLISLESLIIWVERNTPHRTRSTFVLDIPWNAL